MTKQPRRESKGRKGATSNKQKRASLQAKRDAGRHEREKKRFEKLAAAGRYANDCELPEGAIAADLTQQARNNSYGPPLYYVDQPFVCRDCGQEEVWTAAQQKWYFEVAKRPIYGRAVRCRTCRQRERRANEMQVVRSISSKK